jgi:hypothetical protein
MLGEMRHPSFTCAVCGSPPEVRALVDRELSREKRKPLRVIAEMSGFSKSGLSRHDRNCLQKAALEAFRDKRKRPSRGFDRVVVAFPRTSIEPAKIISYRPWDRHYSEPVPFVGPLLPTDLFLRVVPEPLAPMLNPKAVKHSEAWVRRQIRAADKRLHDARKAERKRNRAERAAQREQKKALALALAQVQDSEDKLLN